MRNNLQKKSPPTRQPVKIVRNENSIDLHVSWGLHNLCNYQCSYCPDFNRNGSYHWLTRECANQFVNAVAEHYNKKGLSRIQFSFTGGEPPLLKGFKDICRHIVDRDMTIGMTSNGSLSVAYWEDIVHLFDWLNFSYHPQYVDDDNLFSVVRHMHDRADTAIPSIRFMMHPDNEYWDKCVSFADRIKSTMDNWSMEYVEIQNDFGKGIAPVQYQQSQIDFLKAHNYQESKIHPDLIKPSKHDWDLDVIYHTGERERLRTNDLINNGMVCFKGWRCNVGLELLTVDYSGDIIRAGGCRVGGIIGSVRHDTRFSFPEKPVVCTQDACLCGTNIMVSKSKE